MAHSGQTGLLRDRAFRLFLGARTVSMLGDRVGELVIPFLVLARTGSALDAGLVVAAGQLPSLLFALWAGAIVDRRATRTIMVAADLGRAALFGLLAVSLLHGTPPVVFMVAIMFLVGIGDVWFFVAAGAFLPRTIGRERLVSAGSYLETADAGVTLAGPALGGLLLQAAGVGLAVVADAVSFAASALFLLPGGASVCRSEQEAVSHSKPASGVSRVFAGFTVLRQVPQQLVLQVTLIGLNAEAGAIVLLVVAFTKTVLHLPGLGIGLVVGAAGVGGLLSSVFLAPRLQTRCWGPVLGWLLFAMALAMAALALSSNGIMAFVANGALDGAGAVAFIVAGAARQSLTPDALLGRVSAASHLLIRAGRTGSILLAGWLITQFGQRPALWAFAAMLVLVGAGLLLMPSTRVPLNRIQPVELQT